MADNGMLEDPREQMRDCAPHPLTLTVPRARLEQLRVHLTSVYASYHTRRLRQAIDILEHILHVRF